MYLSTFDVVFHEFDWCLHSQQREPVKKLTNSVY